ncbi:MAG: AMP-binding protein [Spirochaetales bacterium]|nr:AMP-binding protein [Spirochaetales bacterium]
METIVEIRKSCINLPERNAFCIDQKYYTFGDLSKYITAVRAFIEKKASGERFVGIITYNDIETYASILATWFTGKAYVPINPRNPPSRNQNIIDQLGLQLVLSSQPDKTIFPAHSSVHVLDTRGLALSEINLDLPELLPEDVMFVLFTSGSTGIPKGVPINRRNLNAYVHGFYNIGYRIDETDRFLQMIDLSFDVSVQNYVLPLVKGACIYTIAPGPRSSLEAYKILDEHRITFAKMVPSTLNVLRPFFSSIKLEHLKYSLFSGEALKTELIEEWSLCVPNASIQNHYGPTEGTIDVLYHTWTRETSAKKSYNGVISIGKPFGDTIAIITGENGTEVPAGEKGELCIASSQLTTGYIKNPEKNQEAFFDYDIPGKGIMRFYKTGDIAFMDSDGDYFYAGRKDHQVKTPGGFRVELGEIEFHAQKGFPGNSFVAVSMEDKLGLSQIHLCVESHHTDTREIHRYLKHTLPDYMVPVRIHYFEKFPLNTSGKTDRIKLKDMITHNKS